MVWDPDRRFGGRGAWLCRLNRTCWTRALKKRAFGRAFRVGELLDVTAIEAALQAPEEEVAADVV